MLWGVVKVDLSTLSDRNKRVNISVPEKILSKIDSFAEKEGETRSGLLVSAVMEYMAAHGLS